MSKNSFEEFQNKITLPEQSAAVQVDKSQLNNLTRELESGETLEWYDKPVPKFFTANSVPLLIFGIPWNSFIAFFIYMGVTGFESSADNNMGAIVMLIFMIPFICAGLYFFSSPIWEYKKLQHTIYGITNKRALIISKNKVKAFYPREMNVAEKHIGKNGSHIIFSSSHYRDSDGDSRTTSEGFYNLKDIKAAEAALKKLKDSYNSK